MFFRSIGHRDVHITWLLLAMHVHYKSSIIMRRILLLYSTDIRVSPYDVIIYTNYVSYLPLKLFISIIQKIQHIERSPFLQWLNY